MEDHEFDEQNFLAVNLLNQLSEVSFITLEDDSNSLNLAIRHLNDGRVLVVGINDPGKYIYYLNYADGQGVYSFYYFEGDEEEPLVSINNAIFDSIDDITIEKILKLTGKPSDVE